MLYIGASNIIYVNVLYYMYSVCTTRVCERPRNGAAMNFITVQMRYATPTINRRLLLLNNWTCDFSFKYASVFTRRVEKGPANNSRLKFRKIVQTADCHVTPPPLLRVC